MLLLRQQTLLLLSMQLLSFDKPTTYCCVLFWHACKIFINCSWQMQVRLLLYYQLVDLTESQLTMLSLDLTQNHPWQPWDVHSPCCGNCLPSS